MHQWWFCQLFQDARGVQWSRVWEISFYWTPTKFCHVHDLKRASLLNRTAGRRGGRQNAPVLQEWQGHYLRVLSWSSLNIILCFLVFYKMICFKFFKQNYCHTCQTRFAVFFHLPSCCVSSLITGLTTRGQHNLSTICFRNRFYCNFIINVLDLACASSVAVYR